MQDCECSYVYYFTAAGTGVGTILQHIVQNSSNFSTPFTNFYLFQGYDTFLNTNLPNEVLEKLSIARVLMNNPDVLILDDCMTHINLFAQMAIITDFVGSD